jgi:hypothetical protein
MKRYDCYFKDTLGTVYLMNFTRKNEAVKFAKKKGVASVDVMQECIKTGKESFLYALSVKKEA